jgi:hypothetical protein
MRSWRYSPSWGFRISPGLRGYYGGLGVYWGNPWYYPPLASPWVVWWGPSYYPTAYPSADVLSNALPEGVLPPGSRVEGFLYFKRATGNGQRRLELEWELHDAKTNQNLGSVHVPLNVIPAS